MQRDCSWNHADYTVASLATVRKAPSIGDVFSFPCMLKSFDAPTTAEFGCLLQLQACNHALDPGRHHQVARPGSKTRSRPAAIRLTTLWRRLHWSCHLWCGRPEEQAIKRRSTPWRNAWLLRVRQRRCHRVPHVVSCLLRPRVSPISEFDIMQKEDSPSHQTCGTCIEY